MFFRYQAPKQMLNVFIAILVQLLFYACLCICIAARHRKVKTNEVQAEQYISKYMTAFGFVLFLFCQRLFAIARHYGNWKKRTEIHELRKVFSDYKKTTARKVC